MNFSIKDQDKFEFLYFQITDLWQKLCEEHRLLFELTCDEYDCLLKSKINLLEDVVQKKKFILENINDLEELRFDLILSLNEVINNVEIEKVADLLKVLNIYEIEHNKKHLFSFNAFLVDIIEQIQKQTKINQQFINKAMLSLEDIKKEIAGEQKRYSTYDSRGTTSAGNN